MIAGIWKSYDDYINSPEWVIKRKLILESMGYFCYRCQCFKSDFCEHCQDSNEGFILQIHHKNYQNIGNESQDDLEILCYACHQFHHNNALRFVPVRCSCGRKILRFKIMKEED